LKLVFQINRNIFVHLKTMENKNNSTSAAVNPLQDELNEVKAQKEKLERELLAREELMQSMFSLLTEKKK
jgi:hypothetical protein